MSTHKVIYWKYCLYNLQKKHNSLFCKVLVVRKNAIYEVCLNHLVNILCNLVYQWSEQKERNIDINMAIPIVIDHKRLHVHTNIADDKNEKLRKSSNLTYYHNISTINKS